MDGSIIPAKFRDLHVTADGKPRASVDLGGLTTLWFNTGTLCNITCVNCYIESSPRNDALVYLTAAEVRRFLDEAGREAPELREVGFTGGEPFLNPDFPAMLEDALGRGLRVLVLTNAMRPMTLKRAALLALKEAHGDRLALRVSLDHYSAAGHDALRGAGSFVKALEGLRWLAEHGFHVAVAGRTVSGEGEAALRRGFADLFAEHGLPIDADDPRQLVLFPEMDGSPETPEIAESCWAILGKRPDAMMCASSRMVVRRRGEAEARLAACTLLPYDPRFDCGATLAEARRRVWMSHPHCSRFCALGGACCA
ncbi:radical SAM protein [Azospirillum sp. TSO22-1]|uniref:radical SAM protein n=1 Tax=Azospirillum sp. TSO22-1 TaxID=716789 RepID=UPI000D61EC33|nr:radical SAM protein [Azospirillum sp. TSO22-1]PWC34884.1 radical SAM protein [Azospirillum sp. TSO22-1]